MALIVKTIGSASRDYATLALWIASIPANLVTDGNSYEGDCYNDSEFTGTGTLLTIPATTTDATHTLTLTTGAGQSFQDNANVRTNALLYSQSNGVAIRQTDNYSSTFSIGVIDYLTISKLQLARSNVGAGTAMINCTGAVSHLVMKDLIVSVQGSSGTVITTAAGAGTSTSFVVNVLVVVRSSSALTAIFSVTGGNTLFIGCLAVRPTTFTAGGSAFVQSGGTPILQSSGSFGFTTASSGSWDGTNSKNNATDQAAMAGSSNQLSMTYSSATPFTSAADSTRDFRAIAATSLVGNGFRDVTNAPNDISAATRPASPTIGPWEQAPVSAVRRMPPVVL